MTDIARRTDEARLTDRLAPQDPARERAAEARLARLRKQLQRPPLTARIRALMARAIEALTPDRPAGRPALVPA